MAAKWGFYVDEVKMSMSERWGETVKISCCHLVKLT